jgi:hypothetical protein
MQFNEPTNTQLSENALIKKQDFEIYNVLSEQSGAIDDVDVNSLSSALINLE